MNSNSQINGLVRAGRGFRRLAVCLFLLVLTASAERLPLRTYTAADGLATSIIHHSMRDSDGFLWFAGRGGLSRFDGSKFVAYRFSETQSAPLVHSFYESRDRRFFWILTDGGLYRAARDESIEVQPIDDAPRDGSRRMRSKRVSTGSFWAAHETPGGELLMGSSEGLYLIENVAADEVTYREIIYSQTAKAVKRTAVRGFAAGADGSLWMASDIGFVRRTPDGRYLTYETPRILISDNEAYSVRIDAAGRIWIPFRSGLFVLMPDSLETIAGLANLTARALPFEEQTLGSSGELRLPEKPGEMFKFNFESVAGRAGQDLTASVQDIYQGPDGRIWIPAADGLYVVDGTSYRRLQDPSSMPGTSRPVTEDLEGNLWFSTYRGVVKLTRGGLTSYSADSGLPDPDVHLIQETRTGELLVAHGNWLVSRLLTEGFETLTLNLSEKAGFRWTSFPVVQDRTGALWSLQTGGLFRFPPKTPLSEQVRQTPEKIAGPPGLFDGRFFYRAFSDRQGNLWFFANSLERDRLTLLKYTPSDGRWEDLSQAPGYPKRRLFASFAEDGKGNIYFGFYMSSGIFKYADGRFSEIVLPDKFPRASALDLLFDRRGRLWIASTERGIARLDRPDSENPEFVRYAENEGLASANVRCLTEDLNGNIYAGTVRGVSRIEPESGRVTQITTADGLAGDFVKAAFRDSQGVLWFGTSNGISRYEPAAERTSSAPQVYIGDLQIAGVNYAVSEFGQTEVAGPETSAAENNLQIDFFSVGESGAIRYQFKLEGAGAADWSAPTDQRSVNFANLTPGSYRFLVRAVGPSGATGQKPAVVAFKIRPPFYQTWWFLILASLGITLVLYSIYQYRTRSLLKINAALLEAQIAEEKVLRAREEKLAELERVRTRIATDLHDDIGSSLTQIAVLSEVARNQAAQIDSETLKMPLERIKGVSRELVEAMSDVVWAINPQKDNLRDLVQRMRRFGSDVCTGRGVHFEFNAPPAETSLQLGANIRREVFAIFKESVNNSVKYSGGRKVIADFRLEDDLLVLQISDDGRGFDMETILSDDYSPEMGGNGLVNMRRRALELGGSCRIISFPGGGTTVLLEIPLHQPETFHAPPAHSGGPNSNGSRV